MPLELNLVNEAKVITLAFMWVVAIPASLGLVYFLLQFLFQNNVITLLLWITTVLSVIWGALFVSKILNLHEID